MPSNTAFHPLVSIEDLSDYRGGLNNFASGHWDEDRWKTFRLRFGIYAQRQVENYMIRAKIPGGRLSFSQARTAAAANRGYCGSDIHITTRQDFQFYFISLDSTPGFLEELYNGGITTREASGNTFRNIVACPLAGICPHEHVNAGKVAETLSATWIRHPLAQHMPRKFKTTVSGCGHDCGASAIDDLGLIAVTQKGRPGFRVVAGGGLGNRPHTAIVIEDFVQAQDLPAVQEAFARVHHRHSNRENKNVSRLKFLVDKFGEEGFIDLFRKQFAEIKDLPQRQITDVEWRLPSAEGPPPSLRQGTVAQHDGRFAIVVRPPLGMIDSGRLEALTDLAEDLGGEGFRLTRDQNIMAVGLPEESRAPFIAGVKALGFEAGDQGHALSNLVSCPGTSTCTIGITNSNALAYEILEDEGAFAGLPQTAIRISGCHNSCGQHHIGDFGLHSLAKKINGKSAPHYQFHIGGDGASEDAIAIAGPVVPARLAKPALRKLIGAYADTRTDGESVRDWIERIGSDRLGQLVGEFTSDGFDSNDPTLLLDVGSDARFFPPVTATGECAASAVVGEYLADLAETALLDISRYLDRQDQDRAIKAGRDAVAFAIRRLLLIADIDHKSLDFDGLQSAFLENFEGNPHAVSAFNAALTAMNGGDHRAVAPAVENWILAADGLAEAMIPGALPMTVPA